MKCAGKPPERRSGWTAALAIVLPSLISVWSLAGPQLNADTILYSVMSHQKVTLFYWGQNRLANLVAALVWPARDPAWNLLAVLLIHTLAWHGLLWLIARTVQPKGPPTGQTLPTYALLAGSLHLLLTPEARYVLIAEGQPYALSYLALGLAWPALLRPAPTLRWNAAGALMLVLGIGLNPSLVIAVGALTVATVAASGQWRRPAGVLALAAAMTLAWQTLGQSLAEQVGGHDYLTWQRADQKAHLLQAALGVASANRVPGLTSALVFAGLLMPWVPAARPLVTPFVRWCTSAVVTLAGAWLLVFSSHSWIVINHLHYKYFFPVFLAAAWGLALLAAHTLHGLGERRTVGGLRRLALPGAAVLLLGCPAVSGQSLTNLEQFGAFAKALGVLSRLPAQQGPLLVGGDYWQVWPVVHLALQRGVQAFGTAERGIAMTEELTNLLRIHGDAKALGYICLGRPRARCLADLEQLTARPWQLQASEPCGQDCERLQVASPQAAWVCPARLAFAADGNVPLWATAGLGEGEATGRWTVRTTARLRCRWPDSRPPRAARLSASAFLPAGVDRQRLWSGGSQRTGRPTAEWLPSQGSQEFDIPVEIDGDGQLTLRLQVPDAVAPAELGLGGDGRALALSLSSGQWLW